MVSPVKGGGFSHSRLALPTVRPRLAWRGVYAITPEQFQGDDLLVSTAAVVAAGVACLQYRDKSADPARRLRDAAALAVLCRAHGVPLIINDDAELAARVGAAGVHLGEDDADPRAARDMLGEDAVIGVSCYDSRELAEAAVAAGADYVAFGAFFPSRSKQTHRRASTDLLAWAREAGLAAVAIGGIRVDNAAPLIAAGADMLAVIDAIWNAPEPVSAVRHLRALFASH